VALDGFHMFAWLNELETKRRYYAMQQAPDCMQSAPELLCNGATSSSSGNPAKSVSRSRKSGEEVKLLRYFKFVSRAEKRDLSHKCSLELQTWTEIPRVGKGSCDLMFEQSGSRKLDT
jgi:hypothetical protein